MKELICRASITLAVKESLMMTSFSPSGMLIAACLSVSWTFDSEIREQETQIGTAVRRRVQLWLKGKTAWGSLGPVSINKQEVPSVSLTSSLDMLILNPLTSMHMSIGIIERIIGDMESNTTYFTICSACGYIYSALMNSHLFHYVLTVKLN